LHIAGANLLSDGSTSARHVLSHIDVNSVPSDSRDPSFMWAGLKDKTGTLRTASQAAQALQQINDDLVNHENAVTGAHVATAISVDTGDFTEIPQAADTAQKVFDYLDDAEVLNMGQHRATQHANAIPRVARSLSTILPDGYRENVVPPTQVFAYLVNPPNTGPVDDLSTGDDIIKFNPTNSNFVFDAQFGLVKVGDIIRINYGNNIEAAFPIESIRYVPGTEWIVRINGINLFESVDGYAVARIDRALYDNNTVGVLAVASANASAAGDPGSFTDILQSVIVGNPRAAVAYGLGFDPGQLNSTHYKLYLEMYPTGNPADRIISLPAIDVTGNAGTTPGNYDLDSVVQTINNKFREIGFNYRFIAFAHAGEIGIMLADAINNVSFAIINGSNSTGTLQTSIYTDNVIGGNSLDDFDALGFGSLGSDLASPAYQGSWTDSTAAQIPTKIIVPLKSRNYIVNGQRRDTFFPTYLANADGYWDGYISARTPVGLFTVEVTYTINLDLDASKLKPGKTLVVQPAISFDNGLYSDVDYGRFIIKDVVFVAPCPPLLGHTEITVINGIHATGAGFGFSSLPGLPVRIYFGEDSVGFDIEEIIDQVPTPIEYHRFHEIYIDDKGHTFSHERGRLPRQAEDVNKLTTDNLHLLSVSSKLRGYKGTDPLVFNRFIRFYLLDYDSSSGEFDGYLGQPVGTNSILRVGPIVTGRKNVPFRAYDETGIDYVDLVFEELSPSPGVDLISTATPRYVDIELFPTLRLDNELMILGTCEVNWQPAAGQFIVQNVKDARQFGSIDETNFTDSAIDFISAGDRLLHSNGVFRGLNLDSISTVPNSGEIFFKGGIALVNGTIAMVNNMSVTIPQIRDIANSIPQSLDWAICVNEENNLIPILLTSSKQQFFGSSDGIANYYVPSVTFAELTTTRKDLTIIAIANVTISSLVINSVTDVRRFVLSKDYSDTFTVTNDGVPGDFHDLSVALEWLRRLDSTRAKIKISGVFDVDAPIDLSGFDALILEGDGATFNVNTGQGFLLGNNVIIKYMTFVYDSGVGVFAPNDLVNSGNGCLYAAPTGILSDVTIENCGFNCSIAGTQRPPFINIELIKGSGIRRIYIKENNFSDGNTTGNQAAIAIINTNNGSGGDPPAFTNNVVIENNRGDLNQGVYITTTSGASSQELPGLVTFATAIRGNSCGVIGVLNSAAFLSSAPTAVNSMVVENNRCRLIASLDSTGIHVQQWASIEYGTGNITISNNVAGWIQLSVSEVTSANQIVCATKIVGNTCESQTNAFLDTYYISGDGSLQDAAIRIFSACPTNEQPNVTIHGNHLKFGYHPGLFGYVVAGIWAGCAVTVTDNVIRCLATNAIGILIDQGDGSATGVRRNLITGNQLHRLGVVIDSYITVAQVTNFDRGLITNNVLDSTVVNNSTNTQTIIAPLAYVVCQNINQVQIQSVSPRAGTWSIGPQNVIYGDSGSTSTINANQFSLSYEYNHNPDAEIAFWVIPLMSILPYGVTILSIDADIVSSTNSPSQRTCEIDLVTSFASDNLPATNVTTTFGAFPTFTPSGTQVIQDDGNGAVYLYLLFRATHSASFSMTVESLLITYKW